MILMLWLRKHNGLLVFLTGNTLRPVSNFPSLQKCSDVRLQSQKHPPTNKTPSAYCSVLPEKWIMFPGTSFHGLFNLLPLPYWSTQATSERFCAVSHRTQSKCNAISVVQAMPRNLDDISLKLRKTCPHPFEMFSCFPQTLLVTLSSCVLLVKDFNHPGPTPPEHPRREKEQRER